jgi:hypothetical protein
MTKMAHAVIERLPYGSLSSDQFSDAVRSVEKDRRREEALAKKTNSNKSKASNNMAELQKAKQSLASLDSSVPTAVRRWHEARVARLERAVYKPKKQQGRK